MAAINYDNAQKFDIRLINKNDTLANWNSSELVLETGEIALAEVTVPKSTDNPDSPTLYVPTYLMKIGDGSKKFSELPWLHAPAADVYEWAKKENPTIEELPGNLKTAIKNLQSAVGDGGSVAETIANAINALDSVQTGSGTIVKSVTQTDGKVTVTMGTLSADEIPDLTSEKITDFDDAVNGLIDAAIGNLDVTDTAVDHQFVTAVSETDGKITVSRKGLEVADVNGLQTALDSKLNESTFNTFKETVNADAIADAKKAGTDAASALEGYKTTNDDAVKAAADAASKAQNEVDALEGRVATAEGNIGKLIGADTNMSVREIANDEAADIIATALASGGESFDTLEEIAAWIKDHPGDVAEINAAIQALQNKLSGIDDGNGTVKKYVDDAITALKIGDYALAADLTALAGRVSTLEGKLTGITGTVADAISTAKTEATGYTDTKIGELAAIASDGTTDTLIQGTKTIVFNCGNATK